MLVDIAFVTPKSKKAKNRFHNTMQGQSECVVEQHKGDSVFLRSMNGKYFFWVNLHKDSDWILEF
jgi:predicted nucleic acid-binding Zn finger protein